MLDWQPVILSLKIAVGALSGVALTGIGTAFLMTRRNFPGKDLVETCITLPLVLPPIVTGFGLLLLIGRHGPLQSWFGWQLIFTPMAAVLAASFISFPLMYQSGKAALQGVDRNLEDAARTLGMSEWRIFLSITLPLAGPGIVSGMVLAFARALGEFGATAMVAGNIPGKTQTLPVAIYFAAESNDLATAGWYVLLISSFTFGLVFGVNRWSQRKLNRMSKGGRLDVEREDHQTIARLPIKDRT